MPTGKLQDLIVLCYYVRSIGDYMDTTLVVLN